jgi:molecular chaperone GrpE
MENDDNEIVPEDLDDSVVAEEHAQESVQKLKGKLKDAEAKAKEYLDGWQRAQADFVNLRKRDEEAQKEFSKFVSLEVVKDLIPVLDALSLGGNEPVYRLMMQILSKRGLAESDPKGEEFNPRFHESVGTVGTDNKDEDHKILEVAQKGYILHGKIIRPAKVRIGEFISK